MPEHSLAVEPRSIPLGEMTVYADISLDQLSQSWNVTVVFSRDPDLPAMRAQDVDVQLLDDYAIALNVLERPTGPLVEFGGSLGNSVNALFRFQNSGSAPSQLLVTYLGQTVRYRIVSK